MVSQIACWRFSRLVQKVAHPDYSVSPDPNYQGGVCHVGIANRRLYTGSYGNATLYSDGSMHFDIPRKELPLRNEKVLEAFQDKILRCGCEEVWNHPHKDTPGARALHIHANCPPDLNIRRCALKAVLERA